MPQVSDWFSVLFSLPLPQTRHREQSGLSVNSSSGVVIFFDSSGEDSIIDVFVAMVMVVSWKWEEIYTHTPVVPNNLIR